MRGIDEGVASGGKQETRKEKEKGESGPLEIRRAFIFLFFSLLLLNIYKTEETKGKGIYKNAT